MIMKFYIPGEPVAHRIQARPVLTKQGKGFVQFYNPHQRQLEAVKYQLTQQVYEKAKLGYGIYNRPVELRMLFNMPIPKSYTKKKLVEIAKGKLQHVKIPDLTNLVKFIEDCLKGVVVIDDRQVISQVARKQYAIDPGTVIIVETK